MTSLRIRLAICLSLLLFASACGLFFYRTLNRPLPELRAGVVEVARGRSLSEISRAFFGDHAFHGGCFRFYAIISGNSRRLKAGEYELENDSIRSLTRKLVSGKVLQYRVTVAEGTWSADIATLLSASHLADRDKFMALVRDAAFARKLAGPDALTLEGYLFPETYFFTKGMPEEEIIKAFVGRFNEKAGPFFRNWTGTPPHEAVILASIVEREAAVDEERPLIASVFLNRLKKRMLLESCVTVEYAMGMKKKKLAEKDLLVDSPYNTYRHMGLPPGPVCNPGIGSIRAVISPAQTDYLFFVARGDRHHTFSKTWAEHKLAKRKIKRREHGL